MRRSKILIDQSLHSVRRAVIQKGLQLHVSRGEAEKIVAQTANERLPVCDRAERKFLVLQVGLNKSIDRVLRQQRLSHVGNVR